MTAKRMDQTGAFHDQYVHQKSQGWAAESYIVRGAHMSSLVSQMVLAFRAQHSPYGIRKGDSELGVACAEGDS